MQIHADGALRFDKRTFIPITPQSHGYENVTVMYIRKAKIPSHIYAKYQ